MKKEILVCLMLGATMSLLSSCNLPGSAENEDSLTIVHKVSVGVATEYRSGPGEVYDVLGFISQGQVVDAVGRSSGGDYLVFQDPANPAMFYWLKYEMIQDGSPLADLPIFASPPTPTLVPGSELAGGCPTPVGGGPTPVSCGTPVPAEIAGCPTPIGGGPTPVSCSGEVASGSGCPTPIGGGPTPVSCYGQGKAPSGSGCPTPIGGGPTPVSCSGSGQVPSGGSGCPTPFGGGPTPVSCSGSGGGPATPVGGGGKVEGPATPVGDGGNNDIPTPIATTIQ